MGDIIENSRADLQRVLDTIEEIKASLELNPLDLEMIDQAYSLSEIRYIQQIPSLITSFNATTLSLLNKLPEWLEQNWEFLTPKKVEEFLQSPLSSVTIDFLKYTDISIFKEGETEPAYLQHNLGVINDAFNIITNHLNRVMAFKNVPEEQTIQFLETVKASLNSAVMNRDISTEEIAEQLRIALQKIDPNNEERTRKLLDIFIIFINGVKAVVTINTSKSADDLWANIINALSTRLQIFIFYM